MLASVDLPEPFGPIRAWSSPSPDGQVHPAQDLGAVDGHVQALDLQQRGHGRESTVAAEISTTAIVAIPARPATAPGAAAPPIRLRPGHSA